MERAEAFIVDAVRSPIGRRNGTLASFRADELAGQVLKALTQRNGLDPAEVEDVQMGCVSQVGEQGWNIGRMAPLVAGWPDSVAGTTVDRQCGCPGGWFLASLPSSDNPGWRGEWLGVEMDFAGCEPETNWLLAEQAGLEIVRDELETMVEPEGEVRWQWLLAQRR